MPRPRLLNADGVIDFTVPAATRDLVAKAAERGIVHIIGTTGFSEDDEARIKAASAKAVIVKSGNMSLGVNLLAALVKRVAKTLDNEFDIEDRRDASQQEDRRAVRHRACCSAARRRKAAASISPSAACCRARAIPASARPAISALPRCAAARVVGEHSVIFAGPAERIELAHRAEDRMIFARGAMKAALWARGKKPGLYSMADVLGLKDF